MQQDESDNQVLNPFGFHWEWRSRFEPFGGPEPAADPSYVFHTEYVDLPLGSAHFMVDFVDLQATHGSIVFVVHAFDGDRSVLRHFETIVTLRELIERKGRISFSISAVPNHVHALLGHCYGDTDAVCSKISVSLTHQERLTLPPPGAAPLSLPFRTSPILISSRAPIFSEPVSQTCTAAQLEDPLFQSMATTYRELNQDDVSLWPRLITRRILERYDVMREGVNILQLGSNTLKASEVSGSFANSVVDMFSKLDRSIEGPLDVGLFPEEFQKYFDVIVSDITPNDVGSTLIWSRLICDSASCLREGGIGIYTCEMKFDGDYQSQDSERICLSRNEIERILLKLMSRKIDVAEMRYGFGRKSDAPLSNQMGIVPFVIIISRTIP